MHSDGGALEGVDFVAQFGTRVITGTTDEQGQAQQGTYDNAENDNSIGLVGPNAAESAVFDFATNNPNIMSAVITVDQPDLTTKLSVELLPISRTVASASQDSVITTISAETDLDENKMSIAASYGVSAEVTDFETTGSVSLERNPTTISAAEAGASDDAEVVIFAQEEDADGFGVEITTSSGVTAIANIPASMFTTGDRISINTATIDDRLQNVPVVIRDEDGVAEQPQTIPAVVTDPDGKQTTTIFLPIVTQ